MQITGAVEGSAILNTLPRRNQGVAGAATAPVASMQCVQNRHGLCSPDSGRSAPRGAGHACWQVELGVNLEDQHGPAAEWVAQEPNQRAIAKKFKNFLFSYGVDGNERIYWHRLRAVCRSAHCTAADHVLSPASLSLSLSPPE